jgi:hypothetical protein
MNLIGASILLLLCAIVLFGSRRTAMLGMVSGALYLTQQQALDVFGINLTAIRLLEIAGISRVAWRGELALLKWNRIDRALVLLYAYTAVVFLIRSPVARMEMVGSTIDALLCYFTFRALTRNIDDVRALLCALVLLLVPYVALLIVETQTLENPYSVLGADTWADLRDGRLRAMGSFRNPSLLGTLGASLLPLYIGLSFVRHHRGRALAGIALCSAIVYMANSGGPVMAAAVGLAGWCCWMLRTKMMFVRASFAVVVAVLALAMHAPVWYLMERASAITGGNGWHRARLLDVAMGHIGQWWLEGMSLDQTKDWLPYLLDLTGATDITNNFLAFGLNAGLPATALLVVLLVSAFGRIGDAMKATRVMGDNDRERYLIWGLGCLLAVHVATWFEITYFDQIYAIWFMHLAMISSVTPACLRKSHERSDGLRMARRLSRASPVA